MTKFTVLLAVAATFALPLSAIASDRGTGDDTLPCNALCRQWMGPATSAQPPAEALDLHPEAAPPPSVAPTAAVSIVPPTAVPPSRDVKAPIPLPPARPRVAATRRTNADHVAAIAKPSRVAQHGSFLTANGPETSPARVEDAGWRPGVARRTEDTAARPALPQQLASLAGATADVSHPSATVPTPVAVARAADATAPASAHDRSAPPRIAFVLPRLDPAPASPTAAASLALPVRFPVGPPPFDVIAALLLQSRVAR